MKDFEVTRLQTDCEANGSTRVVVQCVCNSIDEIDDVVAWLGLARHVLEQWEEIRADRD